LCDKIDVIAGWNSIWARTGARRRHEADDGMQRGWKAVDLGEPITVPVGRKPLGAC